MGINLAESLRLLLLEGYHRRGVMVAAFIAIALLTAVVGLVWPKSYHSYTSVYVEEQTVVEPLLQGAAVQARFTDRAQFAKETIYGRQFLLKLIAEEKLAPPDITPTQIDMLLEELRERIKVVTVGENMIRIEYGDAMPQRAMAVTQRVATLFIDESLAAKARESASAFAFIDSQVKEYEVKLKEIDQALKHYRTANEDARTGAEAESTRRIMELRAQRVDLEQQLREGEIRRDSLESQLSGEADAATLLSRAEQYRRRMAELHLQLDSLRLTYHDSYPDVARIKAQIAELENAARAAERNQGQVAAGDETLMANPIYQRLRGDLYDTRTAIATLNSRIAEVDRQLQLESERSGRIQEASTGLAQLSRDYEVNTEIYQDLMRRREAARVTMNLEQNQQGLTMRVEEPAFLPTQAMGPRLLYFLLGGLVLGVMVPMGTLLGIQQLDPRIRHGSALSERLGLPLLGVVPHLHLPREAGRELRSVLLLGLAALATVVVIGGVGAMRVLGGL